MTTFSRYYDADGNLHETSMDQLEELLTNEKNKEIIAYLIYNRYYERYLKIFDYEDNIEKEYISSDGNKRRRSFFKMEYKNGFSIMVNCCIVIEALASYFTGTNFINSNGDQAYNLIFKKASDYSNDLVIFENKSIYKHIRNGLLHQGETYNKFKIRRDGLLLEENTINATKFHKCLINFMVSYRDELIDDNVTKWDSDLWDKCRIKLRFIIENTRSQK